MKIGRDLVLLFLGVPVGVIALLEIFVW